MANPEHDECLLIRETLVRLIRASNKSRDQIVEELSGFVGHIVTKRSLDTYTAESATLRRWPAEYDIALCEVLGDYSLLAERVQRAGFRMIGPEEERLIAIGKSYVEREKADRFLREVRL